MGLIVFLSKSFDFYQNDLNFALQKFNKTF